MNGTQETHDRPSHPLGPVLVRTPAVDAPDVRRRAVVVFVVCAALLGVAGWLRPEASGYGSHEQLGRPPCSWPTTWGIPCPTCGMTTAFAHTVRGQVLDAIKAQPLGFLLAATTVVALAISLGEAVTGRAWRVNWYRVRPWWVVTAIIIAVLAILAAWGFKIAAMA